MQSVLVDVDEERAMRLAKALADMADELAQDGIQVGVLLALAVAMYAKRAGVIESAETKLKFAEGWGRMLAYAVVAVENDG